MERSLGQSFWSNRVSTFPKGFAKFCAQRVSKLSHEKWIFLIASKKIQSVSKARSRLGNLEIITLISLWFGNKLISNFFERFRWSEERISFSSVLNREQTRENRKLKKKKNLMIRKKVPTLEKIDPNTRCNSLLVLRKRNSDGRTI